MAQQGCIDELETWEIWPGESAEAYAAFCAYRDLPPGKRTLAAAAERAGFERTESQRERREAPGAIRQWAREFGWRERVRDYELHCDRERREVRREQVRALAQEHAAAAAKVRHKILACLDQLFTEEMVPAHMVRSLATCIDIERQALGAFDEPAWAEQDRKAEAERAAMLDQLCRRQAETIQSACSATADPGKEFEHVIAHFHEPIPTSAKDKTAAKVKDALDRYQAGTPEQRARWLEDPQVNKAVNYLRSRGIALSMLFIALLAAASAFAGESGGQPSGAASARRVPALGAGLLPPPSAATGMGETFAPPRGTVWRPRRPTVFARDVPVVARTFGHASGARTPDARVIMTPGPRQLRLPSKA